MIVSIMNFEQLPSVATAVSSTSHQILEKSSHFDYDVRINDGDEENYSKQNNNSQRRRSDIIHSGLSQRDIDVEIITPPTPRTIIPIVENTKTIVDDPVKDNNIITTDNTDNIEQQLSKKLLKLELNNCQQTTMNNKEDSIHPTNSKSPSPSIIINGLKSPISQSSRSSGRSSNTAATTITTPTSAAAAAAAATSGKTMSHQASITSQVDVIEDRKALRDALYQGIFHRHRRTIFAVGSFIRMLKSRNAQYNTIRSSSEGEDDAR